MMTQGTPLHSVALLDPTTSMWTHLGNPLHGFQYIGNDDAERQRLERLKEDWTNLGTELLLQQIGYDHLDPELLKEAHVGDGRILIGGATYSTMILPPIVNLERAAWEKITEFLDKGGIVIAVGLLPYEHIEDDPLDENEILQVFNVPTSPATDYWRVARDTGVGLSEKFYEGTQQKAYFVPSFHYSDDACCTVSRLVSRLEPQVVVIDDERAKRSILVECRLVEESYLIFIANQDQTKLAIPIRIDLRKLRTHDTLSKQPSIERLNLETGHSTRIRAIMDGDMCLLPIEFHPYESCLIKVSFEVDDQDPQMELRQETPYKLEVSTDQPWIVTPDNPNVLRFDEFKLMLGTDDGWSQPSTVQVKTFIDQCSDIHATQTLPIHFSQVFGTPMQLGMDYPIRCKYTVDFNVAYTPKLCELFMDRGAISGDYFITFNGHKIEPCDFHPKFFYDHANIACPVDGFLREGRNTIEIEVQINRDWDGLVDAIYLAGDFGVAFDESRVSVITTAAREAALCSGPLPSYPFYSGTLSFKRSFTLNQKLDSSNFVLEFPDLSPDFHDCAEVILNGNSLGVCPWSPYQWRGRTNLLQAGANELEVKVTNTLVGTLEGRYFDYQAHQLREVEDVHHRD
ncbi:hypothetical protein [Alicyclobacillus fastidiosus]|uniref:hypothetical protein n=1 Tax=Alicyclobacillus fastidiosus TaxID=392011 RepID=UPI0023E99C6A|nr:hypothetical protein [Alicyclobacillus fastidiosus]GMA62017.1 hypothetical protein GCM10025859_24570 [Alicyclobacillus fastidiosus]